jgi:ubiquinol-cytochrome c reductase cytochrome b subunit
VAGPRQDARQGPAAARGERFVRVVDRRAPLSEAAKELLRKAFPDHWSFLLGEIALYSFVVLVVTGVYLTLFFDHGMTEHPYAGSYGPLRGQEVSEAYDSVMHISFDVRGGLMVRQMHHWAALLFVAAIGLHMLRVFFTGAFRRPRELNWAIGVTLFMLALLEGFCGYSLPDDLLSGTGLRTAQGIMLSLPVVGTYVSFFVFGGEFPGHVIIPRLYALHILLVPGLLIALLSAHLFLVVYLKHTQWAQPGRTNRNVIGKALFPQYAAKSTGLFLIVAGVLAALAALVQVNPIWEYGPYRADQVSIDAQPDWYVGFLEGALRMMPAVETRLWGHTVAWDVLLPGAVLPAVLFLVLYSYPLFERWLTGDVGESHLADRPRNQPVRTALGAAGVSVYAVLLVAGGQDVLAYVFRWPVEWLTYIFRTLFFVLPLLVYWATKRACLGLQAADRRRLERGDPTPEVRRSGGGYQRAHVLLTPAQEYPVLVRKVPSPRTEGTEPWRWWHRHRLRNTLSAWYLRHRVELPAAPEARDRLAAVLAGPEEVEET